MQAGDICQFVGVARWRSRENAEAFWQSGGIVPFPDAELATMEIFTEIDDLVIGDPNL